MLGRVTLSIHSFCKTFSIIVTKSLPQRRCMRSFFDNEILPPTNFATTAFKTLTVYLEIESLKRVLFVNTLELELNLRILIYIPFILL